MPRTTDGCDVCRSRKLRCQMKGNDSCERCTRSGIACPGRSSTPRKWKPRFHDAEKKPAEKKLPKASNAVTLARNGPVSAGPTSAINPAQQMRSQALGHFLESYLPDNGASMAMNHFCYMKTLVTRDERNPALRSAIEAITIAQIGAESQDQALSLHGSGLYASALRQMTHMVARNSVSEDTIAASILLGLCEFTPSTADSNSWIKHVLGQQRMLQIIGPKRIAKNPFAFQLFLNVRNSATSLAMHTRKAIFFDQPAWMDLTKTTALVDPWVALTNLSVALPGLLEELDALAGSNDVRAAATALPLIESHEKQLAAWHARYLANSAAKGPWFVEPSHLRYAKDLDPLPVFSQLYWFADFQSGNIQQCYWAILLGIARVRKAFEIATGEKLGPSISQKDCAIQMAKCAAFSCQPRFGSVGRIAATVVLKYASVAFHEEGANEEAQWCSSLVGVIRADGVCQPPIFFVDQSHLHQGRPKQDAVEEQQTTILADGKSGPKPAEQPEKITVVQNFGSVKPEPANRREILPPIISTQSPSIISNAYPNSATSEQSCGRHSLAYSGRESADQMPNQNQDTYSPYYQVSHPRHRTHDDLYYEQKRHYGNLLQSESSYETQRSVDTQDSGYAEYNQPQEAMPDPQDITNMMPQSAVGGYQYGHDFVTRGGPTPATAATGNAFSGQNQNYTTQRRGSAITTPTAA